MYILQKICSPEKKPRGANRGVTHRGIWYDQQRWEQKLTMNSHEYLMEKVMTQLTSILQINFNAKPPGVIISNSDSAMSQ